MTSRPESESERSSLQATFTALPAEGHQGELLTASELLRSLRARLADGRGRKVSQEAFGNAHGFPGYAKFENGGVISVANMYALAEAYGMDEATYDQFYFLVTGGPPSYKGVCGDARLDKITEDWSQVHVYQQPEPTLLMDGAFNVLHFNSAWARLFDHIDPHPSDHPLVNPVRFLFFHPKGPECFLDWQEGWLFSMLCQFAVRYHLTRDNRQLQEIRQRISEDDFLEDFFTGRVEEELFTRGYQRVFDVDGEVRKFWVPGQGERDIRLTVVVPRHGRPFGYQLCTLSNPAGDRPLFDSDKASEAFGHELIDRPGRMPRGASEEPQTAARVISPRRPRFPAQPRPAVIERNYPDAEQVVGRLLLKYRKEKRQLSQERFCRITGLVTDRTYGAWERGEKLPPHQYISQLVNELRMPEEVGRYLFRLITKREPPAPAIHLASDYDARTEAWARVHVHDQNQQHPSILTDGAWNVVACNDAYRRLFRHLAPDARNHVTVNVFRYVVFHPDARETLTEWYDEWLIPFLAELGSKILAHGDRLHSVHREIQEEVEADPFLRKAFNGAAKRELESGSVRVEYLNDGGIRGLNLPAVTSAHSGRPLERRHSDVQVTTFAPLHALDCGYQGATLRLLP
ncbi:hypothetical protein ACH4VR_29055 [Streptomyces sp. NPDC020883]|uniref:MmyB family transcriptional regulator n=1 Tax=Streptomyces sp. NPDC020883 TaxID=3365099 RepID=UPI0037B30883